MGLAAPQGRRRPSDLRFDPLAFVFRFATSEHMRRVGDGAAGADDGGDHRRLRQLGIAGTVFARFPAVNVDAIGALRRQRDRHRDQLLDHTRHRAVSESGVAEGFEREQPTGFEQFDSCGGGGNEECTNGGDDDGDGDVDCDDTDCAGNPECPPTGGGNENCSNGRDDDGDGDIDCADSDCADNKKCQECRNKSGGGDGTNPGGHGNPAGCNNPGGLKKMLDDATAMVR